MEEAGHYYTVYFTSLAVGFKPKAAHLHALLAQMPDMVGWMDASHMHKTQGFGEARQLLKPWEDTGSNAAKYLPSPMGQFYERHKPSGYLPPERETNLLGEEVAVDALSRSRSEDVLHSLPFKGCGNDSSAHHRQLTTAMLDREHPLSLKFGWLLHRLGDTYAHSTWGDENHLYTVSPTKNISDDPSCSSVGHGCHVHDPDYPFLRPKLFYDYVKNLYRVLDKKVKNARRGKYMNFVDKRKPLPEDVVIKVFEQIFSGRDSKVVTAMRSVSTVKKFSHYPFAWKTDTQLSLIYEIKEAAKKNFNGLELIPIPFEAKLQSARAFSETYREATKEFEGRRLNMTPEGIYDAFNSLRSDLAKADPQSCH